jgi:hypothetical protein
MFHVHVLDRPGREKEFEAGIFNGLAVKEEYQATGSAEQVEPEHGIGRTGHADMQAIKEIEKGVDVAVYRGIL